MAIVLTLLLGISLWNPGELEITFVDVGLGNAVLFITPQGKVGLYDGGNTNAGDRKFGWVLKNRNITDIDWVFYADADSDHYTGLNEILDGNIDKDGNNDTPLNITVKEIYFTSRTSVANKIYKPAGSNLIPLDIVVSLEIYTEPDFKLYVIHASGTPSGTENPTDIVLGFVYKKFKFILTSDKTGSSEVSKTIDNMHQLGFFPLTGMQIPHHAGSSNFHDSDDDAIFISTNKPVFAVASTAFGGSGPLDPAVIERYNRHGINVYRTDLHGDVTIKTNGVSYSISVTKQPLDEIKLEENKIPVHAYPVPAKDKITFVYELKALAEDVRIEVYNILGDRLKTIEGTKNIGKNFVDWSIDENISEGLYFAVVIVKSGGSIKTGRYRFTVLR